MGADTHSLTHSLTPPPLLLTLSCSPFYLEKTTTPPKNKVPYPVAQYLIPSTPVNLFIITDYRPAQCTSVYIYIHIHIHVLPTVNIFHLISHISHLTSYISHLTSITITNEKSIVHYTHPPLPPQKKEEKKIKKKKKKRRERERERERRRQGRPRRYIYIIIYRSPPPGALQSTYTTYTES